jgi:hypothetical protein
VALQGSQSLHHPAEAALTALVDAVSVVDLSWAVDRQADQEVVLGEERSPLVVEQGAVGLDRVGDLLARLLQRFGQFHRPAEKTQPHHRRLAPLPGHHDFRGARVRLYQLPQVGFQQVIGHPEPAAGVQHLLGQEEAVGAVQVADRTGRLGQQMELPWHGRGEQRAP